MSVQETHISYIYIYNYIYIYIDVCRWRQEQYSNGISNTNHQKKTTNNNRNGSPHESHYGCRPVSPMFRALAPEGPAKKKVAVGRFWPGARDTTSSQSQPERGYLQVF